MPDEDDNAEEPPVNIQGEPPAMSQAGTAGGDGEVEAGGSPGYSPSADHRAEMDAIPNDDDTGFLPSPTSPAMDTDDEVENASQAATRAPSTVVSRQVQPRATPRLLPRKARG